MPPQPADPHHGARLRTLSRALQDVHRELIEFSRQRYELAHGPVRSKSELFELVLRDEDFAWLRPLSRLIVEIDELTATDPAPSEDEVARMRARVEAFMSSSGDPDAFGSRYIALLASEPRIAMNHAALRAAVAALPRPG